MLPEELEGLSRDQLIERAERLGVQRASVLTRAELVDEIVARTVRDPAERGRARGLLGVARDLLARVVERGLHLPDAAALIRGPGKVARASTWPRPKTPIATVTLAEIYAAQGHKARALAVLDEVLDKEPEHGAARLLRTELAEGPELEPVLPPEAPLDEPSMGVGTSPVAASAPPESRGPATGLEPGAMLDDAPLPDRYDVDEVVAMPVDPATLYVYWEAREATVAANRERGQTGELVVRVVAVHPSWDGPVTTVRDVDAPALVGDYFLRDLPAGAVLRVALGWRAGDDFEPLVIAAEVLSPTPSPTLYAATELARYTPDGVRPAGRTESLDPALARALERFRRRTAYDLSVASAPPPAPLGSSPSY